jgi:putative membrane protein
MSTDAGDAKPSARRSGRIPFRYWVIIVLAVLAGIFISQNGDRQPVHPLWVTVESAAWLMLTVIFLVDMVVGLLSRRCRR